MSLVGLLALGSCTPPAKNNLSPSQVASPDIKNAPYLLKPSAQTLGAKSNAGFSPEIEAALRQKYGPFVKIGFEPLPQPADFRTLALPSGDNFTQCQGTYLDQPYIGIGALRDLNAPFCAPGYPVYENFGAVQACYNSGGVPVYETMHICNPKTEEEFCFETKFQAVLHACSPRNYASFTLNLNPDIVNGRDNDPSNNASLIEIRQTHSSNSGRDNWTLIIEGMGQRFQLQGTENYQLTFKGENPNEPPNPFYWPDGRYTVTLKYDSIIAGQVEIHKTLQLTKGEFCSPEQILTGFDSQGRAICEEIDNAPFNLLMVHNNLPANRMVPPGDNPRSQVTLSPADINDAFDSSKVIIRDTENQGWRLQILKANGKVLYEEEGIGNAIAGWDGLDEAQALSNGFYTARLSQSANPGVVLERKIRVDNEKPVIANIRVQEDPSSDRFTIKAKLKEAGNGAFQSGVNPALTQLFFDEANRGAGLEPSFDPATGEYSVSFTGLAEYRAAKEYSQQQYGYDFPFELQIGDYAGNEITNRGSGPDGPLRIQVLDPYFSPNADGVKDSLNFKVIAETSEAYSVQVKRNGATVKSWAGLTGEQNLSWDGKFMSTQNLQLDSTYRIVVSTDKQRDRIKDAQNVILDNTPPDLEKATLRRSQGQDQLVIALKDKGSGVDYSVTQAHFISDGVEISLPGTGQELNKKWVYSFNGLTAAQRKALKNQQTTINLDVSDKLNNRKTLTNIFLSMDNQPDISLTRLSFTGPDKTDILVTGQVSNVDQSFDPQTIQLDFEFMNISAQELISFDRTTGEFKIYIRDYEFTVEPQQFQVAVVQNYKATAFYKPAFGIASLPFRVMDYSPDTFTLAFIIDYLPCGEIEDLCNPLSPNNHLAQQDKFLKTLHETLKDYGMRPADGGQWYGIFAAGVIGISMDMILPTSVAEIILNVYPPGKSVFKVVRAGSKSTVLRVTKDNYFEFEKFLLSGVKDPSEAGYFFEALVKYIYKVEGRAVIIDEGR